MSEGAPIQIICSLSAEPVYPKTLTFYRFTECTERAPMDICTVAMDRAAEGTPQFDVRTRSLTFDPDQICDARPLLNQTGTCDIPIESVGSFTVVVDDEKSFSLEIPYDNNRGASCWTYRELFDASRLPDSVQQGEPHMFGIEVETPRGSRLTSCRTTEVFGIRRDLLEVTPIFVEDARRTSPVVETLGCTLPPLEPGNYEVQLPGRVQSLTVE